MLLSFSLPMALNCDPSWLQLWPPCSPICSPSAPQLQCVLFLQVDAYLLDLEVDELPGVGWNMCHKLKDLGIASVRHVRGSSKDMLQKELGSKTGATRIAMPPPCACTCTCALLPGPWAIWPECCFMALLTAGASISCTRNPPPPSPFPSLLSSSVVMDHNFNASPRYCPAAYLPANRLKPAPRQQTSLQHKCAAALQQVSCVCKHGLHSLAHLVQSVHGVHLQGYKCGRTHMV